MEDSPDPLNDSADDHASSDKQGAPFGVPGQVASGGVRPRKKRGRHAKDPRAQSVSFDCTRLEDLENSLRTYLANPTYPAECTTLEFTFPVTAAFMIPAREVLGDGDPADKKTPFTYSLFKRSAVSVVDALQNISDPKERMTTQKSISKTLVDAISEIDGYHYSFHNHWVSNADQANRFSYYCNDSVLNKGRAANEGRSKIRDGVKIRKPVYECEGGIWIKFSLTKNSLDLHYKHIPLHPTFDERAPTPRNGSKRKRLLEIFHPEKLQQNREPVTMDKAREKKRKAVEQQSRPKNKRRATEPILQTQRDDASAPHDTRERESSLQPLFDFLGSAGRLDEDNSGGPAPEPLEDSAVRDSDSAPPAIGGDSTEPAEPEHSANLSTQKRTKQRHYPGMMSGVFADEEIVWGHNQQTKAQGRKKRESKRKNNAADLTPEVASEVVSLRLQLQEAERKIRELEAQKEEVSKTSRTSATPTPAPQQQPQRFALPPASGYLPPPHQYPYGPLPSLQWQQYGYGFVPPAAPIPETAALRPPAPISPGVAPPLPPYDATAARLPLASPPIHAPSPLPNSSPPYGFVPNSATSPTTASGSNTSSGSHENLPPQPMPARRKPPVPRPLPRPTGPHFTQPPIEPKRYAWQPVAVPGRPPDIKAATPRSVVAAMPADAGKEKRIAGLNVALHPNPNPVQYHNQQLAATSLSPRRTIDLTTNETENEPALNPAHHPSHHQTDGRRDPRDAVAGTAEKSISHLQEARGREARSTDAEAGVPDALPIVIPNPSVPVPPPTAEPAATVTPEDSSTPAS